MSNFIAACTEDPPVLNNDSTYDWKDGDSVLEGTVVTYTCNSDNNTKASICCENGEWTTLVLDCPAGKIIVEQIHLKINNQQFY